MCYVLLESSFSIHVLLLSSQCSLSTDEMSALTLSLIVLGVAAVIVLLSWLLLWLSSDASCCCISDRVNSESKHDAQDSVQALFGGSATSESNDISALV